jgi:uncharacterized membrane protein YsdA (DUF1294 family)
MRALTCETPMFPLALCLYVPLSAVTFALYGIDKRRAVRNRRRIKESHLHACELLGGWPGALVAQRVFRHKWRKTRYMVVFWSVVVLHLLVWGWYFKRIA